MPLTKHGEKPNAPTRADWPLLALYAAEDGVLTPVQMQKVLFLLDQEVRDQIGTDFYNFKPYNYGPFASEIYNDLVEYALDGWIVFDNAPGRNWNKYVITAQGEDRASEIIGKIDAGVSAYLTEIVAWAKSLRFSELVGAIYKAYPDYAKNSIFSR
jgi:hypothetical protein